MTKALAAIRVAQSKIDATIEQRAQAQLADHAIASRVWPKLNECAYYGVAGEIVHTIEPRTEADPAGILVQTLVAFGALVGRGPHVRVEGDEHHAHLFALLVGGTSKGRKGTSWGRTRQIYEDVEGWKPPVSGLSSGEGLKYHVRDASVKETATDDGDITSETIDPGVPDKRLLVIESEFAQVLRAVQRTGSTLSPTVREAWDTGRLATLTKNDPITATGAHISIIGHITEDELRAELTATDTANGFANRFLFVGVKRSKLLPFGGDDASDEEVTKFATRLSHLARLARTRGRISMTEAARDLWIEVYPRLSAGGAGLFGAVTARAEAQCIRLALIFALLDGVEAIDQAHLLAAVAVWDYCSATAEFVFGNNIGDRVADEILKSLRTAASTGRARTEIRDLFKRHQSADRIEQALELLRHRGLARVEQRQTAGRPVETWFACDTSDRSDQRMGPE